MDEVLQLWKDRQKEHTHLRKMIITDLVNGQNVVCQSLITKLREERETNFEGNFI